MDQIVFTVIEDEGDLIVVHIEKSQNLTHGGDEWIVEIGILQRKHIVSFKLVGD